MESSSQTTNTKRVVELLKKAEEFWQKGDQDKSFAIVKEYLKNEHDARVQCFQAEKLIETKAYTQAIEVLEKAQESFKKHQDKYQGEISRIEYSLYLMLGIAHLKGTGNRQEAKQLLLKAQELAYSNDQKQNVRTYLKDIENDLDDDQVSTDTSVSLELEVDQERFQEAKLVFNLLQKMDRIIQPGTKWYILSMEWVKKWQNFVYFDYLSEGKPLSIPKEERTHPGPLDNSAILLTLDPKLYFLEQMKAKVWQNNQLKPGLKEEEDYMIVDPDIFKIIEEKYGVTKNHEIIRAGIPVNDDEAIVEVYLRPVKFLPIPNQLFKFQEPVTVLISRVETLEDLFKKFQRALNIRLYQNKEKSVMVQDLKIWKSLNSDLQEIGAWDKKYKNYTQVKIDAVCLLASNDDFSKKIEDLDIAEEDILLAELPKVSVKGKTKETDWTLAPNSSISEEETKQIDSNLQTESGGHVKLEQIISLDIERVFKPSSRRGVCGLQNLGNTCFMNSGLQCLSNTIELTKYFCFDLYKKDINKENPLGMGGRLATSYAELVKEMWLSNSQRTAPHELKKVVGKRVTKFSGFGQQDSCELINYVLDLMHEDLNRVKKKPYIEMKDSEGRPDEVVSAEHWDAFLARNKSIIVDLMYGQLKSTVECQECKYVSITFDPFLTVSLPISRPFKLTCIFVPNRMFSEGPKPEKNLCKVYSIALEKESKVSDLEKRVADQVYGEDQQVENGIQTANFWMRGGFLTTIFKKSQSCQDIDQSSEDTLLYELHVPQNKDDYRLVQMIYMKQVKMGKTFYGEHYSKTIPRLEFLRKDMTIFELKRLIYANIKPIFKEELENENEINRYIAIHVFDNLPTIKEGKYTKRKADCEFCKEKHGQNDTCDLKIKGVSANNDEGAKEIRIEDIFENLVHKRELILGIIIREGCGAMMKMLDPEFDQSSLNDQKKKDKKAITLDACFKAYSRNELLTGNDQWYCSKCKEQRDIHKKLELFRLPKILIIQLKRFQSKRGASQSGKGGFFALAYAQIMQQEKVGDLVDFPVNGLDLRPYLAGDSTSEDPIYYDLYAVSNHFGSLNGGHYTAYGFNAPLNKWYEFNDSSVSTVSNVNEIVSSGAYLLFYRKRD